MGRLDAGDVGGEKVDAVAVGGAAGAVVVHGGAGVCVSGRNWASRRGDAGVEGVGESHHVNHCRSWKE